ncbi:Collagen alpha-5(VI) chain [Manis javanica]|nr:Collagen alpha-5(VI) chain [Manis javanica]
MFSSGNYRVQEDSLEVWGKRKVPSVSNRAGIFPGPVLWGHGTEVSGDEEHHHFCHCKKQLLRTSVITATKELSALGISPAVFAFDDRFFLDESFLINVSQMLASKRSFYLKIQAWM